MAINGFGRIGRTFFRQAFGGTGFEVVAVNDLGSLENLAYLLKYDSVYREFNQPVEAKGDKLIVGKKKITFLQEKDPANLPWKDLGIDIVVEATGVFRTIESATAHLQAGAKRVVITAPAKDDIMPTITPNVAEGNLSHGQITSNASCTTNAVNPVIAIMSVKPGIEAAVLNTVHGYTSTQSIVDGPNKSDFRKGRAGAVNIIPTTTGSAIATTRSLPHLEGKFDGIALRVPLITGSLIDLTFIASRKTSVEEINQIFQEADQSGDWTGILTTTTDPIVSSDIIGNPHGSIVDLGLTRVINGNLVKILAWYDNEWGYCAMLKRHVESVADLL